MVVVLILHIVVRRGLTTGPAATGCVGVRRAVGTAAALPAAPAISAVVVGTLAATISAVLVLPGLATDPAGVGVRRAVGAVTWLYQADTYS